MVVVYLLFGTTPTDPRTETSVGSEALRDRYFGLIMRRLRGGSGSGVR
jgi:hypothetical protein